MIDGDRHHVAVHRDETALDVTLGGLAVLYARVGASRGRTWSSWVLWGWALVGWGLFNLVEGLLDHHLLAIHHVMSGPHQGVADLAFLALGALLVLGGWLLQRSASRRPAS